MIGLLLEVFYWKETEDDDEVEIPMSASIVETRYFISIENYGEYVDIDGNQYTSFMSGGQEFVTMYKIRDFQELLMSYLNGK